PSPSESPSSRRTSIARRSPGPGVPTRASSTSTRSTGAGTSRPGSSRSSSPKRCGRPSGRPGPEEGVSMSKETAPLVHGDRALAGYFPAWINDLAEDVVLEGSAMNGVLQGADAVRSVLVYIRSLYEHQEFSFAGPYGEDGFLEDYTARVRGE